MLSIAESISPIVKESTMPSARHLLVASLSLLATAAHAQYAWVGTYNPNGEGVYRFTVDAKTGDLHDKTLVAGFPTPPSSPFPPTAKSFTSPAKQRRAWCRL